MEKIERTSMNLVEEKLKKIKEVIPEAFIEGKIDFGVLQEELGKFIDKDNERYSFNWKGKSEARRIAQEVSTGTLRPEQSVLNATHTHTHK